MLRFFQIERIFQQLYLILIKCNFFVDKFKSFNIYFYLLHSVENNANNAYDSIDEHFLSKVSNVFWRYYNEVHENNEELIKY